MSASYSSSSSPTTTENVDKRLTTSEGDLFALQDSNVTVEGGGTVNLITKDPESAIVAIKEISAQTQRLAGDLLSATTELTQGSNEIAAQVADSQKEFVATASGQSTAVLLLAGAVAVVAIPTIVKIFKK